MLDEQDIDFLTSHVEQGKALNMTIRKNGGTFSFVTYHGGKKIVEVGYEEIIYLLNLAWKNEELMSLPNPQTDDNVMGWLKRELE